MAPIQLKIFILSSLIKLAHSEICLFSPFITSAYVSNVTSNKIGKNPDNFDIFSHSYNIKAVLDYHVPITLENFDFDEQQLKTPDGRTSMNFKLNFNKLLAELDQSRDIDLNNFVLSEVFAAPLTQPVRITKHDYYQLVGPFLESKRISGKSSPELMIDSCSPLYIHSYETYNMLNISYLVAYKKQMICLKALASGETPASIMSGVGPLANYEDSLLKPETKAVLSLGRLRVRFLPNYANIDVETNRGRQMFWPLMMSPLYHPSGTVQNVAYSIMRNHKCRGVINSAAEIFSPAKYGVDYLFDIFPITTITKVSDSIYKIKINNHTDQSWTFTRDKKFGVIIQENPRFKFMNENYDSISIAENPNNPSEYTFIAVYYDVTSNTVPTKTKSELVYGTLTKENFTLVNQTSFKIDKLIMPDDIAHWESCKKVVSVYGFAYSLHDYNQNIFTDSAVFRLFDEKLMETPIEAITIERNQLLIMTRVWSLLVFDIEQSNCNELVLLNKQYFNYRQIFDRSFSMENGFPQEARFYKDGRWFPAINDGSTPLHVYVLIGAILAFTVIALAVGALFYWLTKQAEKNTLFSRSSRASRGGSRGSAASSPGRKSLQGGRERQPAAAAAGGGGALASSMPLFSEAASTAPSPVRTKPKSHSRSSPSNQLQLHRRPGSAKSLKSVKSLRNK